MRKLCSLCLVVVLLGMPITCFAGDQGTLAAQAVNSATASSGEWCTINVQGRKISSKYATLNVVKMSTDDTSYYIRRVSNY